MCRRVTAPWASALEYVPSDSVEFLRRWRASERGPIHLLYLDSLDYLGSQQAESARHHQAEAEAALPSLAAGALLLIDDTHPTGATGEDGAPLFDGKGSQAVPFLMDHGFQLSWSAGGRVLLARRSPLGTPEKAP
jgi:hypothetical protein